MGGGTSGQATAVREPLERFAAAVADDLDMLAALHAEELTVERVEQLIDVGFPANLGLSLDAEHGGEARDLLAAALTELADNLDDRTLDRHAADYSAIYVTNAYRAAPTESVWLDEDGLAYQQPMFQVRDWYQRYGLAAENWRKRSDDHLVIQLQFVAWLLRHTRRAADLGETARFLDEHLLRWLQDFSWRVAARCDTPFYAGLCLLTSVYVDRLRDLAATVTGEPRPTSEEIEARMKPRPVVEEAPIKYMPGATPSW